MSFDSEDSRKAQQKKIDDLCAKVARLTAENAAMRKVMVTVRPLIDDVRGEWAERECFYADRSKPVEAPYQHFKRRDLIESVIAALAALDKEAK